MLGGAERRPAAAPAADEVLKRAAGSGPGKAKAKDDGDARKNQGLVLLEAEQKEARDKFFTDSVTLSRHLKTLREAQAGGSQGGIVKSVGERTFIYRYGLYVESAILAMDAAAIESKIRKVEAYSAEYFDLMAKSPDLAQVLALGENLLFLDHGSIIQIVPKAAAPESKPTETETR
jgi:hypothetical protein